MDGANDSDHSMTWEDFFGIFGGKEVSIETVPYMAGLIHLLPSPYGYRFDEFCGGSIIHERFILTAAQCFRNVTDTDLFTIKVSVGADHWYHKPFLRMVVEKKLCHENYMEAYPHHNDMCLLKLTHSVRLGQNIALVQLPDENFNLKARTMATLTGWGEIEGESYIRDALRQVTIPVMENNRCHRLYRHLSDKVFCAGRPLFGDCKGDNGGPLVSNGVQIGVMSFGGVDKNGNRRCGKIAGVYTKVSSYLNWINKTISDNL